MYLATMSKILVYVPTIRQTIPIKMKRTSFTKVRLDKLFLYRTQISMRAGQIRPNMDIHSAPIRPIANSMNGITAATAPGIQ